MLLAGLRRIGVISAALLGGTAAVSALLGVAAGASLARAVSVGLYILGALLLAGCFVFGVKGPLRGVSRTGDNAPLLGAHGIRRASGDERSEATRTSILLFAVGIGAVILGSVIDPLHRTF